MARNIYKRNLVLAKKRSHSIYVINSKNGAKNNWKIIIYETNRNKMSMPIDISTQYFVTKLLKIRLLKIRLLKIQYPCLKQHWYSEDAAQSVNNERANRLQNSENMNVLLFVLSIAFDFVTDKILLIKLARIRIRSVIDDLFWPYLWHKLQRVFLDTTSRSLIYINFCLDSNIVHYLGE